MNASRRRVAVVIAIAVLVPVTCVSVALSALALPHFVSLHSRRDLEQSVGEVRANLHILCTDVANYHDRTGVWLAAGPAPKVVPEQRIDFVVEPSFEQLGFAPRKVQFQYQVIVDKSAKGEPACCRARGRTHAGGPILEAKLPILPNGKLGVLSWNADPG